MLNCENSSEEERMSADSKALNLWLPKFAVFVLLMCDISDFTFRIKQGIFGKAYYELLNSKLHMVGHLRLMISIFVMTYNTSGLLTVRMCLTQKTVCTELWVCLFIGLFHPLKFALCQIRA